MVLGQINPGIILLLYDNGIASGDNDQASNLGRISAKVLHLQKSTITQTILDTRNQNAPGAKVLVPCIQILLSLQIFVERLR